ncbi:MAG: GTPase HflX [Bdellovibrio sp.]|nr:GTPase HflX [Bdellovibrio sp.]
MHKTESEISKAILVGLQLPGVSEAELQSSLDELSRLVTTLGFKPVGRLTQKRDSEKNATVLGEGKLQDLAKWTGGSGEISNSFEKKKSKAALKFEKKTEDIFPDENLTEGSENNLDDHNSDEVKEAPKEIANIVIFDCDLSPSQLRNVESAVGCPVLDRTGVIIEIFSRHAKTKASRLQVEIARLSYVAPRLRETGGGGDRGGGGVGAKGSGETSLELDRRRIRDRIKELKTELGSIDNEHLTRRARRDAEITVALVGYTNAGKSSLMRAMTGSEVLVADKLFATLDTTIRPIYPESRPKILFSDTVGFIKKLPHDLVASFKSTLDEALNASLLLYVVDSSDATFRAQLEVTQKVLSEVGITDTPSLLVLNKIDRLTPEALVTLRSQYPDAFFLSTRDPDDLQRLREYLIARFEEGMIEQEILVSYALKGAVGEIRAKLRVMSETHNEKGFVFKVRGNEKDLSQIKTKFRIEILSSTAL